MKTFRGFSPCPLFASVPVNMSRRSRYTVGGIYCEVVENPLDGHLKMFFSCGWFFCDLQIYHMYFFKITITKTNRKLWNVYVYVKFKHLLLKLYFFVYNRTPLIVVNRRQRLHLYNLHCCSNYFGTFFNSSKLHWQVCPVACPGFYNGGGLRLIYHFSYLPKTRTHHIGTTGGGG